MSGKEKNSNYQDNLFYISDIIRRTSSAIALEIDPNYWREYILKDLAFILKVQEEIYANIKANTLLITRLNSLNDLKKSFTQYINLLDIILSEAFPVCKSLCVDKPRLTSFLSRAGELCEATKELIKEETNKSMKTDHETVSENEYKFLFSEDNNTD